MMDGIARTLLEKLLAAGDKSAAGVRRRAPSLTAAQLRPYLELRSLQHKTACEDSLLAARSAGAIDIVHDRANPKHGFIERVNLRDIAALARFLGKEPYADVLAAASRRLSSLMPSYPVLADVQARWAQMSKVRTLGPRDVQAWLDAAKVLQYAAGRTDRDSVSLPIREASARLFKDSKLIERLAGPIDVLLTGSVDCDPRQDWEVFQEIGLFREERPALLAGRVEVARERVTALLDAPYCGLPAYTVHGVTTIPELVMTIENLTTFHSEAKRRADEPILLIYTAGMPSPSWRAMYGRLLASVPEGTPIYHWGDIDEGGFRIAAAIAREAGERGRKVAPWRMHPDDVPQNLRRPAGEHTVGRMVRFAEAAGWPLIAAAIANTQFVAEQESLTV